MIKPILIITELQRFLALEQDGISLTLKTVNLSKESSERIAQLRVTGVLHDQSFTTEEGHRSAILARMTYDRMDQRNVFESFYPGDMSQFFTAVRETPAENVALNFSYFEMAAIQALALCYGARARPFGAGEDDEYYEDYALAISAFFQQWREAIEVGPLSHPFAHIHP